MSRIGPKVISEIRRKEEKLKGTPVTSERQRERLWEEASRQALERKKKKQLIKSLWQEFLWKRKKKERIVKNCGLIGMKKKKKDKDGSNTIVFEIREYRFRTEYDSGYVSALGMVAWFEFTSQWRVVSLLFQLLAPSPLSLNVYSKICRAQTRCRWPIVFCFFEGIRWNEWTRRKRYPFQEVKIFHPPSDKFVKKPVAVVY